ncbi:hypothetical protein IAR50_002106 [Cryptococcus sp. DSM 104548]
MSSRARTRPPATRAPTRKNRSSPVPTSAPTPGPSRLILTSERSIAQSSDRKCVKVDKVPVAGYMRRSSRIVEQRIVESQPESLEDVEGEEGESLGHTKRARYDRPLMGESGWANRLQPVAGPSRPIYRPSPIPTVSFDRSESQQTTMSFASLPDSDQLTIRLAMPQGSSLNQTEAWDWYVAGEEVLVDSMRKEKEGVLERRGWNGKGKGKEKACPEDSVMWLSAPLSHPCTCSVDTYAKRYTLAHPPPQHQTLSSLPSHPEPSHIPKVGPNLPGWMQSLEKDIDITLDEMEEFEVLWKEVPIQVVDLPDARQAKGVQDDWDRLLPVRDTRVPIRVSSPSRLGARSPAKTTNKEQSSETSVSMEVGREDIAKRRRAWWRNQYASDQVYGQVEKIIRPRSRGPPNSQKYPRTAHVQPYTPPTQLSSWPYHPYHPDIHHFIQKRPWARVCWVIPIHGPVHIPRINDPLEPFIPPAASGNDSPTKAAKLPRQLVPSAGKLVDDAQPVGSERDPQTIQWTPQRLRWFIKQWMIPSWQDDTHGFFGPLSWAIQSGNLDWWAGRDQRRASSEAEKVHVEVPEGMESKKSVKAEMGDCMRIWCDARRALSLRLAIRSTWVPAHDYSLLDPEWPVAEPPHDPATLSEDEEDYEMGIWEEKGGPVEVQERIRSRETKSKRREEARRKVKKEKDTRESLRSQKRTENLAEIEKTRVMFLEKARLALLDSDGQVLVVA